MSRLLDITLPLGRDTPVWEDSPGVRLRLDQAMSRGHDSDNSVLECDCHAGTHVDAPSHYLPGGRTVDALDLDALCGPVSLRDIRGRRRIGAQDLALLDLPRGCRRLLLRTDNTRQRLYDREFFTDFCGLTESGAQWCVHRGLVLLGLDYLSVARFDEGGPVHRLLLDAGVVLVEGLDLSRAPEGEHELFCLPLKLAGAEGAPARCVLRLGECEHETTEDHS